MMSELDAIHTIAAQAVLVGAMAENIPSPCLSVCRLDLKNVYCEGCLRTIDEIRVWRASSDLDKKAIWVRLAERATALSPIAPQYRPATPPCVP